MSSYRSYECNICCPKLKALKSLECTTCNLGRASAVSLTTGSLTFGNTGVEMHTGFSPLATTHVFTSTELPPLANRECNGEITFYLNNDLYVNVTMAAVVKSAGAILQTVIYQRVGNYTSVDLTFSGNVVTLTVNPPANCRWIWRGI